MKKMLKNVAAISMAAIVTLGANISNVYAVREGDTKDTVKCFSVKWDKRYLLNLLVHREVMFS